MELHFQEHTKHNGATANSNLAETPTFSRSTENPTVRTRCIFISDQLVSYQYAYYSTQGTPTNGVSTSPLPFLGTPSEGRGGRQYSTMSPMRGQTHIAKARVKRFPEPYVSLKQRLKTTNLFRSSEKRSDMKSVEGQDT